MTKRDVRIFLEKMQNEKISEARQNYWNRRQEYLDQRYEELGLMAVAGEVEGLLNKALSTYEKWVDTRGTNDGVKVDVARHGALSTVLYPFTSSKGACFSRITEREIRLDTPELDRIAQQFDEDNAAINANYNAVISTLSTLGPKEIGPYLTELGFDISELEDRTPQMLAAKIEPFFLLPQEKAA